MVVLGAHLVPYVVAYFFPQMHLFFLFLIIVKKMIRTPDSFTRTYTHAHIFSDL